MNALTAAPTTSTAPAGFSPVLSSALRRLGRWDIDLYVLPDGADDPVLLRDAKYEIDEEDALRIIENKQSVLVRDGDFDELSRQMLDQIDTLVADTSVPAQDRFAMFQFAAAAEVQHACKLVNPDRLVELGHTIANGVTTLMQENELTPLELFRIARHDHLTFVHVTNSACYAVMLGSALSYTQTCVQREIALAAFLHDIGKRHIPGELLRKPGRLTDEERDLIQRHPQMGYEELLGRDDVTRAQLMVVYQHHEWVNGGGYPVGITKEEIHPWSRLLAVVDVFDALTGKRTYRRPCSASEALGFLEEKSGIQFDPEIVKCWKSLVEAS